MGRPPDGVAEPNGQLDPDIRFRLPTHIRESKVNCHQARKTSFAKELTTGKAKVGAVLWTPAASLAPYPLPLASWGWGTVKSPPPGGVSDAVRCADADLGVVTHPPVKW